MLVSEFVSKNSQAPIIVLFGGNPYHRDEVITHLQKMGNITIYGTLSEEEGMEKITTLPKVDVVLIGGRYSDEQRIRIRQFVAQNLPNTKISEPGVDFPYENEAIKNDIKSKISL